MRLTAKIVQMLIRLCFVVLLVLGALFWSGRALDLVNVHMLIGTILVLGLWVMAILGIRARAGWGLIAMAVIGGLVVMGLGMAQTQLVPGDLHWTVRVVHLLVGVAAIGLAEQLAARITRAV